ncbi:FliM/FliN family flagellar motor switch protein [Hyphomicrobium sp. D-2]|uniref:flagellar motor switch protein FliM n=1 Tax=Hyphomicrobium sp. D-2 TaxID=3041621 RepID=UPI002453889F|nr:FliM/FliN family flagellar motor switch protein [Hyphomicrobium sp. D-2]MDH4983638.1 FliM/FliN family flagellar motor switch protein [Hyphomicrobium sp. D-2]
MVQVSAQTRGKNDGLFAGPQDLVERMPMLRTILQKVASSWSEQIKSISSTTPEVVLVGVESGPPNAVMPSSATQAVACVVEAPNWNARLILCADHEFVFTLVEMLLGGDGSEPAPSADRELTRTELGLAQLAFNHFAGALELAFASVAPTNFTVGPTEHSVSYDVLGRMNVPVVVAKFHMFAHGFGGAVTLMLSQSVLSPMRNELSRTVGPESVRPDPAWSQKIQSEVSRANVDLVAVLDEQELTLADVARFAVGKVIRLGATPDSVLRVECNGERLINCEIGKSNGAYALRIRDFIDQEQEFMNDILAS